MNLGNSAKNDLTSILNDLRERRKELNCLYRLEELMHKAVLTDVALEEQFHEIVRIIPHGWQYPDAAQVKLKYLDRVFCTDHYQETTLEMKADIFFQGNVVGQLTVSYQDKTLFSNNTLFLEEEKQLIKTIADRIGHIIMYSILKESFHKWKVAEEKLKQKSSNEWKTVVELMESSNPKLFMYMSQKMLYYLCWNGVAEAKKILQQIASGNLNDPRKSMVSVDSNQPIPKESLEKIISLSNEIFRIASENLGDDQIILLLRQWSEDEKSRFLVKALEMPNLGLNELINTLTRFRYLLDEGIQVSPAIEKSIRVSLSRYFLSDHLDFIKVSQNNIHIADYFELVKRIISPAVSQGRLGGKSAGLFLATQVIKRAEEHAALFADIRIPKTWYITANGFLEFIHYNHLESILEQKYKEMDEIHVEYPNIIQIFKNSYFPPEVVRGLEVALDDLGERPVIIRSSSLLEDRMNAAFSGKYKSLFLANRGSKEERLNAMTDAICEVYASIFSPDAIEYRKEMGLLDFNEEMCILIQEVVGVEVGNYFFPTFAGVAFSNNEFRWSARISREDGLIRIVPGLGTRAVDRVADDYSILIAPGKPDLRVNVTSEEVIRYSPKKIDVINLDNGAFETVDIQLLLKRFGSDIPGIQFIISTLRDDLIQSPTSLLNIDFEKENLVVTFEGLFQRTSFVEQIGALLKTLQKKIGTPVDIEFAHDGRNLYLLQCRSQTYSTHSRPAPIPKDIGEDKILFSALRYVTNGYISNITHVVYVDPDAYNQLNDMNTMKAVGRAVGKLNKILPKRQFLLIGPGRWGSRGDIKMGVNVTYADINNASVLIEVARKKGNYIPELSFGTHFFQDLVESSIRYLPLYPDEPGVIFNQVFFNCSENILAQLLPEYSYLVDVLRVIDVPQNASGAVLRLLMNADLDEALCIFAPADASITKENRIEHLVKDIEIQPKLAEEFWRWRSMMAERIVARLDFKRFGVKGVYLFGSTKNATAGPASDIDLLIHFIGTSSQKKELLLWLEGWSMTLAEINYMRTGYKADGLLDVHLITDTDIKNKTSFAVKIRAVTDAARPLRVIND